ncbi:CLUMA_CG019048, isoform A [Clunio marinus]|uniref:CLUMA_CG019048, isoform A n=1 Tax=Clunio marinus TaxID=568069 RepID=A0A1J1J0E3_9DIPT|nr:CLUMA_CG019048, isoform A [Clunio marinus]
MCGGFYCSRNSLILLNLMYIVVGGLLISSAVYGNRFTDLPIIPSIIGCGVVLISLALMGLYGAAKHHQVTLFFYMIILFCLFIVQFAIACSCLAVSKHQQRIFAEEGWNEVSDDIKAEVQTTFGCCGFNTTQANDHPSCDAVNKICCSTNDAPDCTCLPCLPKLEDTIDSAFRVSGSIGLFFSFTELLGVILTVRYRNQKNLHASAFL